MMKKHLLFTIITLSLFLLVISIVSGSIMRLDRNHYELGDQVLILLNKTDNYSLTINTPADVYKYLGGLEKSMNFVPREEGQHLVKLYKENRLLEQQSFQVGENPSQSITQDLLVLEKREYSFHENVMINVNHNGYYELNIRTNNSLFKYSGTSKQLEFTPQNTGIHTVQIIKNNEVLDSKTFEVIETIKSFETELITLEKYEFMPEESVDIFVKEQFHSMRIKSETDVYNYLGMPENPMVFRPKKTGEYTIEVFNKEGVMLQEEHFSVKQNGRSKEDNLYIARKPGKISLQNPQGKNLQAEIKFQNNRGRVIGASSVSGQDFELERGKYEVDIIPETGPVKQIRMKGLQYRGDFEVGVDVAKRSFQRKIEDKVAVQSYAINPEKEVFDEGQLTATAKGTELWKCADWNFAERTCIGEWIKIKDLQPGKDYTITFNARDPAYTETGVATINSIKPIYYPNESAVLKIAVLNTEGYLTDADVSVNITNPGSVVYEKTDSQINRERRGIYNLTFEQTTLTGTYEAEVRAEGEDVNFTLMNTFEVRDSYAFDILRDMPLSIDPWAGPYNATIRLDAITYDGLFNYTEIIPKNFTIEDKGGGILTSDEDNKYLTWNNLQDTTIKYIANSPKKTPDLYTLEGYIEFDENIFEEARPWYLAIDPTPGDDSLSFNVTQVVVNGTVLLSAQTVCSGGGRPVSFSFWPEDDGSEILNDDACSSKDFEFVSSTINLCTADTCTQGSNARIDVTKCSNNAEVDVDWVLKACGTNEPVPENHTFMLDSTGSNNFNNQDTVEIIPVPDTTPPSVTLGNPADNTYTDSSTVTFYYTASDNENLSTCTLIIDGTQNETDNSPNNGAEDSITATLGDGNFTWNVNCSDTSGNTNISASSKNIIVDTTPPSAVSLTAPENDTVSTDLTPTFDWTQATESNFENYTILLDNNQDFSSPEREYEVTSITTTDYTPGSIIPNNQKLYWKVITYDKANHSTDSNEAYIYTTDNTAPSSFDLTSPDGTTTADSTPELTWDASSDTNFANYTVEADTSDSFPSPAFTGYTYSASDTAINTTSLSDGTYYWRVTAYDKADQSTQSSSTFNFTADTTPPAITLLYPPASHSENETNNIEFNYSVTDSLSEVSECELIIDGLVDQTESSVTEGQTLTFLKYLDNGNYTWEINCTDSVGNENNSGTRQLEIVVITDSDPPVVQLNYPKANGYVNDSFITFNYTPSDGTGINNCSIYLDGELNQTCAGGGDGYNDTVNGLSPSYRWPLSGNEDDVIGTLNSNGGSDPSWVSNIIPESEYSQAGDYDGSTSVTQLPDAADINTDTTYEKSISLWFVADTIDTSGNGRILWEEGGGTNWISIYTLDIGGTEYLFATVGEGGSGGVVDAVNTTVSTGTLYHVLFTMDTNAGEIQLYVNGVNVDSDTSLAIGSELASHGSDPAIGGPDGSPRGHDLSVVSGYHDGRIADVIYWAETAVLNGTDASAIYSAGNSGSSSGCTVTNNAPNYFNISSIPEGVHNWTVGCYDSSASNNYAEAGVREFTVDTTAPETFTLASPDNIITNDPTVLLSWTGSSDTNFANYTVFVDNNKAFASPEYLSADASNDTTSDTTTTLSDSLYYWFVRAYDQAGNFRNSTNTYSFTVDTAAPGYSNINEDPADPVTYDEANTFHFNITWTDVRLETVLLENDFSGSLSNNTITTSIGDVYYYEPGNLAAGTYYYTWLANDSATNWNETTQYTYTVNKKNSTINLNLDGNGNVTVNESQNVTINATLIEPTGKTVTVYKDGSSVSSGSSPLLFDYNFTVPGLFNITAVYSGNENYTSSSKTYFVTVNDVFRPNVTLINPANSTTDYDGDVTFEYKVLDAGNVTKCDLIIDGSVNETHNDPKKGTVLSFTKSLTDGNYTWTVNCSDSADNYADGGLYGLEVLILQFSKGLLPISCTDGGGCSAANINESDNTYDEHGTLSQGNNYVYASLENAGIPLGSTIDDVNVTWEKYQSTAGGTFYLEWNNSGSWLSICDVTFTSSTTASPDDVSCDFSSFPSVEQFNSNLGVRANFYYSDVQGGREYGSDYVSVGVTYTEDATPPSVTLNSPDDFYQTGAGYVSFNYTPTDANLDNCTLYFGNSTTFGPNITYTSPVSGSENNFSVYVQPGLYLWNVMCSDVANNTAFAASNYTLNVTQPDLVVESGSVVFSDYKPKEGALVNVNATISNEGLTTAENFAVQFFHGDPDAGGSQINSDITIDNLTGVSNTTVNITFNSVTGPNNIFVIVDAYDSVEELSEDNNEANSTIHVSAYQQVYGKISKNIYLQAASNDTFYSKINVSNFEGNIFVTDSEANINFDSVYALGKSTVGANSNTDFSELDSVLGMTDFNDSVNKLWAQGTDTPEAYDNFTIYEQEITDVPIINSTNTSNFVTGILWDSTKDDGDLEYDPADKEDIIFVSKINLNSQGKYGVYDYELRFPVKLREYLGPDLQKVSYFYELP